MTLRLSETKVIQKTFCLFSRFYHLRKVKFHAIRINEELPNINYEKNLELPKFRVVVY